MEDDFVLVKLPKRLVALVEREVLSSDGLFSDVSDYIQHSVVFWRRNGS